MRGVLDEVDEILSELSGDKDVRIIVILQHGRLEYGHPPPINYFFPLNISSLDVIYDTITKIIELEAPIIIQELDFSLLIIFLGGGGLPVFLNVGT